MPTYRVTGNIPGTLHVTEWPQVQPQWGEELRHAYGLCAHPNFQTKVYGAVDDWTQLVADMGATMFRGMYAHQLPNVQRTVVRARQLGLRWVATVFPEDWSLTDAQLVTRLDHLRAHAADVVVAIEGVNEPNHERGGGPRPVDWAERTVRVQRIIWDYVHDHPELAHVAVLSPSLHATVSTAVPDHYTLQTAGLVGLFHHGAKHRYHGGRPPWTEQLSADLDVMEDAWDCRDVWVTETGYTNAVNRRTGHVPTSERASAMYAMRNLLEFTDDPRVRAVIRYEALDDPDPQRDDIESNFGLVRCPSLDPATWALKPEYEVMQSALRMLRDDATWYDPPPVEVDVVAPADVRWLVTDTSTASPVVWLWRPGVPVWDTDTLTDITPTDVDAQIHTPNGSQTVTVGGAAVGVPLPTTDIPGGQ